MLFDYHIHSTHSGDCQTPDRAQVMAGIHKGLTQICFTDHLDIQFFIVPTDFEVELPSYYEDIGSLAREFEEDIIVKTGVEVGLQLHILDQLRTMIHGFDFDYILASRHVFNEKDGGLRPDYAGRSRADLFETYIRQFTECIRAYDDFNCLSHLTYYSRMYPREDRLMTYQDAPEALDEMFRLLIRRGQGIEVNTSTYDKFQYCMPDFDIVRRFVQLGGEVITIGSDAHYPRNVGGYLFEGLCMMQEAGVRYVCTFDKRQPVFHPIGQVIQTARGNTD